MYYNSIDPNMGFQAGLKGIVAQMIGGMGNVPGAIAGSLLLGLIESYGIAAFGTSYRNLFAFVRDDPDPGAASRTASSAAAAACRPSR